MHPRNPYSHLDFGTLAETFEPLKPHLKAVPSGTGYTIDFKNSEAQRRLTEALLYRDFKLHVVLSEDRLCPPAHGQVPNRLNYILWLQDILQAHDKYIDRYGNRDAGADVCGIDIGTGASAIYPLLGCHVEAGWKFVATELDETSFTYAKRNVEMNSLGNRIHLVKTTLNDPILLPLSLYPNMSFDFTMCNPPFYGSADEIKRSAAAKELPPNGVCTGAQVEMITPGGELGFISRILNESIQHSERCRWYTSMLGKLSSVIELVKLFRDNSASLF
ncbi:hypothetical protein APHAL10511_008242 [Amanita phalloides]|nr:hypothetical protein APHAL10511_008242 [Amanita phalloides]